VLLRVSWLVRLFVLILENKHKSDFYDFCHRSSASVVCGFCARFYCYYLSKPPYSTTFPHTFPTFCKPVVRSSCSHYLCLRGFSVVAPIVWNSISHLAFATLLLPIPFVVFLKLTASSRLSAPPSGSPKCLRFGLWLTLCTLNIALLTYLHDDDGDVDIMLQEALALKLANMMVELFRGNQAIIDEIVPQQLDAFVTQLRATKVHTHAYSIH